MNKDFLKSPRTYLLALSTILILLIIIWPIYFFAFSSINLISINFSELVSFAIFELALIIVLIIFWEFYRRFFKINN